MAYNDKRLSRGRYLQPVPLIRAATVAGIAGFMDAQGAPTDRMLERARVPLNIRENACGFVPGRCAWDFFDEIARGAGRRDFLYQMTRRSEWRRCRWVPALAHAVNLGDVLRKLCASWVREIPMNRMGLAVDGPMAWFWRSRIPDVTGWSGSSAAEQSSLSYFLEVIRVATGRDWQPAGLMLECSSHGWGAACPDLADVRRQYSQPLLAVGIPSVMLALPISIQPLGRTGPAGEPAGEDFQSSLRQVLRTSMVGRVPSQGVIAEMLRASPRSLRRRLAAEGTSWRSVLHEVRFERASELLTGGRASLHEIAQELGYSDQANFTRFFRQRTGVAPSRWRAHVERAREQAAR
jgi:AraC-like DNA-binding protein